MSFPASATDLALESRIHELVAAGSMEISPRELHRLKDVGARIVTEPARESNSAVERVAH
jgi:hypothetical protein